MNTLTEDKPTSLIFVYAIILAFCSIIYELLFANTLSIITGNYILWHSLIIGGYIGGLGLGAHRAEKSPKNKETLLKAELTLSLFGGISVLLIYFLHSVYFVNDFFNYLGSDFYSTMYFQNNFYLKTCFFLAVEILVIFIGFLSGFEIPILMKLREEELGREQSNIVLGASYLGTLVGSICFAVFLLPKFGIIKTSVIIACLNLIVCIWILFEDKIKKRTPYIVATIGCFLILAVVNNKQTYITQSYLKFKYYLLHEVIKDHLDLGNFLAKLDDLPTIERTRSKYQNIDLIEMSFSATKKDIVMHLDNHYQFNSYNEEFYHEGFSHVPISLAGKKP
jgi:spermidine synthase